ncbi:Leghemoglobin Lb120 [Seminavis robusta]|uniref:Leghemoglobin Lb120 n=1 Tax=Seminavis robusta TaxID=568900 RepID=A0A9N8E912_9STRA|nr:Leghemoglobin Lb120 [Seminavis robusta]|eukprot:Sro818_g207020.1 Leghemoglobin Lb120 (311) ;mRNA; r:44081-45519
MSSLEMDYDTIFQVMDSWELLRRLPDYEATAGSILFTHLFEKCPSTKALFGFFPLDKTENTELVTSTRFVKHARYMIQMLDKALNMLGPDAEILQEILTDLGKKHSRMGVKAEFFPLMGEALIQMMKDCLREKFTPDIEKAWGIVYAALSGEMVKAMNDDITVINSWNQLKKLENYEEVAGTILFRRLFQKCPETKTLFGFPVDMDTECSKLMESRRFKIHSKHFVEMLDKALFMLEVKRLEDNMKQLGELHVTYGVKEEYFPIMGEALIYTLKKCLPDEFNPAIKSAWNHVYLKMSTQMITSMKAAAKK